MKLGMVLDGDLTQILDREFLAGERAVTSAMRGAATRIKADWRGQVTSAGLGRKLANAIRSTAYPQATESMNAAALAWTNAPRITAAHESGALIRSADGFYLAIPTGAAGRSRRRGRITPAEWEGRTGRRLRFVYNRAGSGGMLVDDGVYADRKASDPMSFRQSGNRRARSSFRVIFILVRQAKLPKRLNLITGAECIADALPAAIVSGWQDG